jgi:hypothetical protein
MQQRIVAKRFIYFISPPKAGVRALPFLWLAKSRIAMAETALQSHPNRANICPHVGLGGWLTFMYLEFLPPLDPNETAASFLPLWLLVLKFC